MYIISSSAILLKFQHRNHHILPVISIHVLWLVFISLPNLKFPLPSSLLGFLSDLCCSLGILSSTLSHRTIHINSTFSQEQCPLKSQYIKYLVASKGIPIILLQLSNLFVSLFWPPNSASYLMAALGFFVPNHFVLLLLLIMSTMWA